LNVGTLILTGAV